MFEQISEAFWLRAKEYVAEQGLKNTLKRNAQRESNELNMIKQYCSLYPKDYPIGREHLIRKLISEGLVDGRSWELPSEEEWTKDLEVSFLDYDIQRTGEGISLNCPMLSTLLLWGNQWLKKTIPNSFFSKMNWLCTLDLRGNYEIIMPRNYIINLTSLETLFLKDRCYTLKSVPYLRKMNALRELYLSGTAMEELLQGLGNLHIGEPMLDSHGSHGERLLTNEMVGDAFIENPEMVLNRMEDRQVTQMPMAPPPSQTPPSLRTPMVPSPSQTPPSLQMLMAPSPSQTPPSAPPLMQFLQYVVPTMLVFLTMRYGAKPEALFGKHRIPLRCFIATTSIYWLTAGVMKQMVLTTKASQMCYLVLSQIALASGIQSLLFLLSMFLNHVPPMMISLLVSAPIALLIVHLLINMVFGAGERNSTDQPVRLPV